MFDVMPCKTKAVYETKLKKTGKLNLNAIKKQFTTLADAGIVLVIKVQIQEKNEKQTIEDEIIVQEYGTLQFKTLKNEEQIRKIAKKIYEIGLT